MAVLTTKKRNSLKESQFGEPKSRKYPMNDKEHAIKAKGRATEMVKKGYLSKSKESKIDAKANKIIGKKRGRPRKDTETSPKVESKNDMAYKKLQEKHDKLKEKHSKMKEEHKENLLMLKQKHKAKLLRG